jgi:transposase
MEQNLQRVPGEEGEALQIEFTATEWEEVDQAQRTERRVRHWRRYQAIRLLAQGKSPDAVASAVGCRVSSVYTWMAAWKRRGSAGLAEARHGGRHQQLEATAIGHLAARLAPDPHQLGERATKWTVPLLLTQLQRAGAAVSAHTLRRTRHRLGGRGKRPRDDLGRPDPAYELKKATVLDVKQPVWGATTFAV